MTLPVLPDTLVRVSIARRVLTWGVVGVARALARRPPRQLRRALERASRGARPATHTEAKAARDTVLTVSTRCCGPEACLPRSIAAALLCRLDGSWPTWCAGVLPTPPFAAHAWIEVDGELVDEPVEPGYYRTLVRVPRAARKGLAGHGQEQETQ
ncbi:lasso peptide biosynthesis B2 protein [Amycolatopsis aidingensis]|uniref:lasso peptide biosynthesis B2 protein n=1 Tax=Amycolatopsis aidingensis TaxID=2842453 RepID=UPI001C0DF5A0|nr:lasso peptide biosynthesis B2 protein [Amycolatopsis aidingensis]